MPEPRTYPAASPELVEHVAAAFHTLLRSWHYNVEAAIAVGARGTGPVRFEPWLVQTQDATWVSQGRNMVDVANTWWEDLPSDWRERFLDIGSWAASSVIEGAETGCTPDELNKDEAFLDRVASQLRRDWLTPPRVISDGASRDAREAERRLAAAVHVYAARLVNFGGLGTVPEFPPPDFSDTDRFIKLDDSGSEDKKRVTFRVIGEALDPEALTQLTGMQPETAYRRGDLRIRRDTGEPYAPYRLGMWAVTSRGNVDEIGPSVEDHIVWLLERLEPHAPALAKLIREHDARTDFYCGYWQRRWNSAWELTANTLRRVVALGASFGYDAYAECEADERS